MIRIANGVPDQSNDAHPGFRVPTIDQQFVVIDGRLFDAIEFIEGSRKVLHFFRAVLAETTEKCDAWQEQFEKEQQRRHECIHAYRVLFEQHKKVTADQATLTNKHMFLQQQLIDAQLTIRTYESITQDDGNGEVNPTEQAIIKMKQLEVKVTELEQEKSQMVQTHERALRNAAECMIACERKIEELEDNQKLTESGTPREAISSLGLVMRQEPSLDDNDSTIELGSAPAKKGQKRKEDVKEM